MTVPDCGVDHKPVIYEFCRITGVQGLKRFLWRTLPADVSIKYKVPAFVWLHLGRRFVADGREAPAPILKNNWA